DCFGIGRRRDSLRYSARVLEGIGFEPDRRSAAPAGDSVADSPHALDPVFESSERSFGLASEWFSCESRSTDDEAAPFEVGPLGAWPFHAAVLRRDSGSSRSLF